MGSKKKEARRKRHYSSSSSSSSNSDSSSSSSSTSSSQSSTAKPTDKQSSMAGNMDCVSAMFLETKPEELIDQIFIILDETEIKDLCPALIKHMGLAELKEKALSCVQSLDQRDLESLFLHQLPDPSAEEIDKALIQLGLVGNSSMLLEREPSKWRSMDPEEGEEREEEGAGEEDGVPLGEEIFTEEKEVKVVLPKRRLLEELPETGADADLWRALLNADKQKTKQKLESSTFVTSNLSDKPSDFVPEEAVVKRRVEGESTPISRRSSRSRSRSRSPRSRSHSRSRSYGSRSSSRSRSPRAGSSRATSRSPRSPRSSGTPSVEPLIGNPPLAVGNPPLATGNPPLMDSPSKPRLSYRARAAARAEQDDDKISVGSVGSSSSSSDSSSSEEGEISDSDEEGGGKVPAGEEEEGEGPGGEVQVKSEVASEKGDSPDMGEKEVRSEVDHKPVVEGSVAERREREGSEEEGELSDSREKEEDVSSYAF